VLAGGLAILAALFMGLARLDNPLWSYAAPVAATLSLVAFIEASRQRAVARGRIARLSTLVAGGLSWFLLATGLMGLAVSVATPNWLVGIISGAVTATGGMLVRRVLRGVSTTAEAQKG
jgi:hypothetical protein